MNNPPMVLISKLAAAGLLSTSLAACVATDNNTSSTASSDDPVVASSSVAVSSSVPSSSSEAPVSSSSSSEMSSSSLPVISSSSMAPSSSSVASSSSEMSSSSVASSSSAPADICGPLVEKGDTLYNTEGFACVFCHGETTGTTTAGGPGGPIDTLNPDYGMKSGETDPELDVYISTFMGSQAPLSASQDLDGDSEAIAAYLYDAAGWNWCDDGDAGSSESSSSSEGVSSSQASGFITSCDDAEASNLRECVDFEDVSPGAAPDGFVIEGGAVSVVSGEEAYSGITALKVSSQRGSGYMKLRNFSATHWGRLYYKNTKKEENFTNWSHTTLVASQGGAGTFRFLDTVAAPTSEDYYGTYQHLYNTEPNDLSLEGPYDQEFEAVWKCFEWSVDTNAQTYYAYLDEVEIPLANGYDEDQTITNSTNMDSAIKWDGNRYAMTPIPATLDWIGFGIQNYQNHSNYEFYLDDIAISDERIGCGVTP